MKTKLFSLLLTGTFAMASAQTTILAEGFDNVPAILTTWTVTNQSSPLGATAFGQGASTVFPSQTGVPTSFISANYNNTTGAGTISTWLITPQVLLQNGDIIKFWTRTAPGAPFADRMEVRSSQGAAFTTPVGAADVGSFNTVHLQINPTLLTGPTNYPDVWTEYTITVGGVSVTPVPMNLAFRYFVTNGGPSGSNSNFIGIDTFSITRPALAVSDASKSKIAVYPNPVTDFLKVNSASKISSVEIFDRSGKKIAAELIDGKIDVQGLAIGTYVIKIQDQEGTSTQKFIKK